MTKRTYMEINMCQKKHHLAISVILKPLSILLLCLLGLTGCAGFVAVDDKFNPQAPASSTSDVHIVEKNETLFSLAWRYGWDYKQLASANSIKPPYTIFPGQTLSVEHSKQYQSADVSSKSKNLTKKDKPHSKQVASAYKAPKAAAYVSTQPNGDWAWPANGKIIAKFSTKDPINKGIDIAGTLGESVMAARDGSVVYAGSGLLGYGNLVIIKHDEQYLSAYAHNKSLLVKENQQVKAGQIIAEIGSSGTDKVKLHFEIRRQGKPVDPLTFLPKAN